MLKGLLPRIMGFLVIIVTLSLGPTIYTANSLITTMANGTAQNTTNLIALTTVAGFGAFIIIFGLLITGGMLAAVGNRGGTATNADFMRVIGTVIGITVILTIFPTVCTYVNTLINAAIAAGDDLGEVGFGIVPVVIYVTLLATAGWTSVTAVRNARRNRRSGSLSTRSGY